MNISERRNKINEEIETMVKENRYLEKIIDLNDKLISEYQESLLLLNEMEYQDIMKGGNKS